jgi:hypothetical protein
MRRQSSAPGSQGVHDDLAVLLRHLGFHLGEDAQEGAGERDDRLVLLGPEVVGVVLRAVDGDHAARPSPPFGRQLGHLVGVVAPAVADLDADRDRVFLFGVVGALGQIQGLVDGAVGVDHEMGRQATACAAARPGAVVHRLEARARVDAAIKMQDELRDDGLQVFQRAMSQALARAVTVGIEVATAPGLVDAAFLVRVEALFVVPQHDRTADVEGLPGGDDGGATGGGRAGRRGGRGLRGRQ